LRDLIVRAEFVYLNANENNRFVTEVPVRDHRFSAKLKADYPQHKFERLAPLVTSMRLCKAPEEIELMKQACNISKKAFDVYSGRLSPA